MVLTISLTARVGASVALTARVGASVALITALTTALAIALIPGVGVSLVVLILPVTLTVLALSTAIPSAVVPSTAAASTSVASTTAVATSIVIVVISFELPPAALPAAPPDVLAHVDPKVWVGVVEKDTQDFRDKCTAGGEVGGERHVHSQPHLIVEAVVVRASTTAAAPFGWRAPVRGLFSLDRNVGPTSPGRVVPARDRR